MANKFCLYCGSAMDEGSNFCQSCGKSQTSQASSSSSYSSPSSSYASPAPSYQPAYTPPYSGYNSLQASKDVPLKVGQYIGMFILSGIPLVGFILLLVWAFSGDTNTNKKNYARGVLLLGLIGSILMIVLSIVAGAVIAPLLADLFDSKIGRAHV